MSTTERKLKEKEHRRNDILKAAKDVFFKNGYENTSMDKVAEAAQLAKGTLYLYFTSKEELYLSLVEDGIRIFDKMLQDATPHSLSVNQRLINGSLAFYEFSQEQAAYHKILMMIDAGAMVGEKVVEQKMAHLESLRVKSFAYMEQLIQEGIDSGELKKSLKPEEALLMLWAATMGAVMFACEKCKKMNLHTPIEPRQFVENVISGLLQSFQADTKPIHFKKKLTH
jgi:AcrR family transcriptional regulator